MRVDVDALRELLTANARYWAAEAVIIDAYWDWGGRSLETDLRWLSRQCHKELVDGVHVRLAALEAAVLEPFEAGGTAVERAIEGVRTEHDHLRAFAAVHDAWAEPGQPRIDPATLSAAGWEENRQLMELRRQHRIAHADLGRQAFSLTEGGGGVLYASGASLVGRGGIDADIAVACAGVQADERDHLVEGLDDLELTTDDLARLQQLTIEQGRLRLPMRWAQFSGPIPLEQLHELVAHGSAPSSDVVDEVLAAAGLELRP